MKTKLELKPNNVKEVEIIIEGDSVKKEFDKAAEYFKPNVKVQGFRPGMAPLNMVKKSVDPTKLSNRVLDQMLGDVVADVIKEHKLKPISTPKLNIKTINEEKIEGTLTFVERPNIRLADYKKLSKEAKKQAEEEFKKIIEEREKTKEAGSKEQIVKSKKSTSSLSEPSNAGKQSEETNKKSKEQIDHEEHEKIHELEHRIVEKIYDLIIEKSEIELAKELIDDETNRLITSFLNYLTRLGIKFEDYIKQTGADITKIQEDYKVQAEKNLKVEFILSEVAKKEDLKVTDAEINEAIENTPDERYKAELKKEANKYYIESQLLKQKSVRKLLELSGFDHFHD